MTRMSKEQRKAILKEMGYTKEEMKDFWKDCIYLDIPTIKAFERSGLTWKDLTEDQLRQLPGLADSYLSKKKSMQLNAAEISNDYVESQESLSYEEELYQKITSGERLTERELRSLVQEFDPVDEIEGDDLRWTRCVESIVELCGHYYSICWQRALTECQEDEFWDQPVEVKSHEKWVKETEWVSVNEEIEKGPVCKELPCDIGDTVWLVEDSGVHKAKVSCFHIGSEGFYIHTAPDHPYDRTLGNFLNGSFTENNWNKIIFAESDKEKADAEFARRQKEQETKNPNYEEQEELEL